MCTTERRNQNCRAHMGLKWLLAWWDAIHRTHKLHNTTACSAAVSGVICYSVKHFHWTYVCTMVVHHHKWQTLASLGNGNISDHHSVWGLVLTKHWCGTWVYLLIFPFQKHQLVLMHTYSNQQRIKDPLHLSWAVSSQPYSMSKSSRAHSQAVPTPSEEWRELDPAIPFCCECKADEWQMQSREACVRAGR